MPAVAEGAIARRPERKEKRRRARGAGIKNRARPLGGHWSPDGYDVFDGEMQIGRIVYSDAAPSGRPWMWSITCSLIPLTAEDRGYAASLELAMAEFKARWEA